MWMYGPNGKPVQVPDEKVAEEFLAGRLGFAPGARIPIVDPEGKQRGTVPAEGLHDALAARWRVEPAAERQAREDEKKFGSLGQEVLTGVEGAAAGATLGLSRVAGAAMYDNAAAQAGRQRTNPVVSTVSEIAGAVAPVIATAGEAAPAAGARAAPAAARLLPTVGAARAGAGVAGIAEASGVPRIAARALGGAVEGGVQSAGMQLSEDVLHEQPSSPDKFISAVGLGALVGGGTSGVMDLVGAAAAKGLGLTAGKPPARPSALAGSLDAAREAIETQAEADPTTFVGKIADQLLGKDRARATARFAKDRGLRDLARTAESDANRVFIDGSAGVAQMADDVGSAFGTLMQNVKRAEIDAGLAGIDATAPRQRGFEYLQQIRAEVDRMAANPADFGGVKQINDIGLQIRKLEQVLGVKKVGPWTPSEDAWRKAQTFTSDPLTRGSLKVSDLPVIAAGSLPRADQVARFSKETMPVMVRRRADGAWEILDGNHRLAAARKAGMSEVPVAVVGAADGVAPWNPLRLDPKVQPSAKELFDAFDQVRHNFDNIAHLGEAASAMERPAANVAKGLRKGIKEFLESREMFGTAASSQAHYNSLAKEFIDAGDEFFETGMFGKRAGYVGGKPDFKINPGSMEAFFKSLGEPGNELRKQSFLKFLAVSKKVADEFEVDAALQARLAGAFEKTAGMAKLAKAMATLRSVKGKVTGIEGAVQSTIGRHIFGAVLGNMAGGPFGAVVGAAAPFAGATVLHVLDQALAQRGAVIRSLSKVVAKGRAVRDRAPHIAVKILNENRFSDRKYDKPARTKEEAFFRTAAEITLLKTEKARRQEQMAAKLGPIMDAAPQLGAQAFAASERAFDYLASKLPKNPIVSPFASIGLKIPPNEVEIEEFASVVRALSNPVSVLEDLATGRLSIPARDAVMNAYPELYAEMRVSVAEAIAEGGAEIDYEQRLQLALFFSMDEMEPSLSRENIIAAQSAYQPQEPPGGGAGGQGKATKSTKTLKSIQNAAGAMDRLEMRESNKDLAT